MNNKLCRTCGETKVLSEFAGPRESNGKPSFDSKCRVCRSAYNRSYYRRMAEERKVASGAKACVSCNLTIAASKFGKHPGRKDGLQSDCKKCRADKRRLWLFKKALKMKSPLPGGTKTCSICKDEMGVEEFSRETAQSSGLASACRSCLSKRRKENLPDIMSATVSEKWCPGCLDALQADMFSRNRRSRTGLWTYCRDCERERKQRMRGKIG